MGLLRNTALPETLEHAVIVHEPLMAMIPHDHPLANNPSVTLAELAKEPFVFFDPHVGTGLYDDILGLMRRYNLTPVITQEVGEAMTIIGLVFQFCLRHLNVFSSTKCAGCRLLKRMRFLKCGWSGRNIMNKVRLRVTFVFIC